MSKHRGDRWKLFARTDLEESWRNLNAEVQIKLPNDFAAGLYVRDLVLAHRHEQTRDVGGAVDHNVGALQHWISKEAVVVEVFVFDVFQCFFVGGDAFEPA